MNDITFWSTMLYMLSSPCGDKLQSTCVRDFFELLSVIVPLRG